MEMPCWNVHQKLVPDPFLVLVNNPKQPLHARNPLKIIYFERKLSKSYKKVNLFLLLNPTHFIRQDHKKQRGPRTSDQSLFKL